MKPLDEIKLFVEGHIDLAELQNKIKHDKDLQKFLQETESHPPYTDLSSNAQTYIEELNPESNDDCINAEDLLSQILLDFEIKHQPSEKYLAIGNIKHKIEPKWLDISSGYFSKMLKEAGDKKGKALQDWLKQEVKNRFQYEKTPPKWLQNPEWPIHNNTPMTFIKQEKITSRHDDSFSYIFMDKETGYIKEVIQSA